MRNQGTLVVGVDGSAGSDAAMQWAACTATRLDQTLLVVSVDKPHVAAELVAAGRAAAHAAQPDLRTQGCVATGQPADQLRRLVEADDLLVVGQHGAGAFGRSVIGSIALQLANFAPCPVVVTRPRSGPGPAPVTVGVDESAPRFAFDYAAATGDELRAVLAYEVGNELPQRCRAAAAERLDATLQPYRKEFPTVVVRPDAIRGPAARALVEASRWASLVVVGARGGGGFAGLRLGSVAQHVLCLAGCPVAVVPSR